MKMLGYVIYYSLLITAGALIGEIVYNHVWVGAGIGFVVGVIGWLIFKIATIGSGDGIFESIGDFGDFGGDSGDFGD